MNISKKRIFSMEPHKYGEFAVEWLADRLGATDVAKYYQTTEDGCMIGFTKEDENLSREFSLREHFLNLLGRIRRESMKLRGGGCSPLPFKERVEIEQERERLYLELLEIDRQVQECICGKKTWMRLLPAELNNDDFKKILSKAIEKGLIDDNYKWLKGMQLLACFCHDVSQKLTLGKGGRIAWKPFEELFGIKKGTLRSNYNDIQKTGQNPSDIALVDSVFQ